MRRLLALLLILTQAARADLAPAESQRLTKLVDEYVSAKTPEGDMARLAAELYMAKAVVGQLSRLQPADYNDFVFELLGRYIARPAEREKLYTLVDKMHEGIETELQTTAELERGPGKWVQNGATLYGLLIFAGMIVAKRGAFWGIGKWDAGKLAQLEQLEARALPTNRWGRLAYRNAGWVASGLGGSAIGYLEYVREKYRNHKVDPEKMLEVVHTEVLCNLSYWGLDLQDRSQPLMQMEKDGFLKAYPPIKQELDDLAEQTALIKKQNQRLENLDVGDRLFQKTLASMPKSFQALRKSLRENGDNKDRTCQAVSSEHLEREVLKLRAEVVKIHDAFEPPPAEPTKPSNAEQLTPGANQP